MNAVKSTGKDIFQYGLAALIVVGFFVLMVTVIRKNIPEGNKELIYQLFGALTMSVGAVVQFFFGSNKDSSMKTSMLYNSTPTAVPPVPTTLEQAKADYLVKFGKASPLGKGMFEIQDAINKNTPFPD